MTDQPSPSPPAREAASKGTVFLGCAIMLGLLVVIVVIIMAVANSCQSKGGNGVATTGAPVTSTAPPSASKPAGSPPDRAGAAAILKANVDHYRQVFHQGQEIVGHTQYPDGSAGLNAMKDPRSPAARFRDYRKNPAPERDVSYLDAFRAADAKFTADNEPTEAISKWQNDIAATQVAIGNWVQVATDYQISGKSQADLDAAAAAVENALKTADADADVIGKG